MLKATRFNVLSGRSRRANQLHVTMSETDPYETPRSFVIPPSPYTRRNMFRRVAAATLLGAVGYCVYFGSVFVASFADAFVSTSDASWAWGGIVAFAFAASECFDVDTWSLNKKLLRRLIVSAAITIVSLVIAGQLCMFVGIEIRRWRSALFLPRIGVGLPIFVALTLIFRRGLKVLI